MLAIAGMFPYGSDCVGVSLVRWMLSLTPAERLATLEDFLDFIQEARSEYAEEQVPFDPADAR